MTDHHSGGGLLAEAAFCGKGCVPGAIAVEPITMVREFLLGPSSKPRLGDDPVHIRIQHTRQVSVQNLRLPHRIHGNRTSVQLLMECLEILQCHLCHRYRVRVPSWLGATCLLTFAFDPWLLPSLEVLVA